MELKRNTRESASAGGPSRGRGQRAGRRSACGTRMGDSDRDGEEDRRAQCKMSRKHFGTKQTFVAFPRFNARFNTFLCVSMACCTSGGETRRGGG